MLERDKITWYKFFIGKKLLKSTKEYEKWDGEYEYEVDSGSWGAVGF